MPLQQYHGGTITTLTKKFGIKYLGGAITKMEQSQKNKTLCLPSDPDVHFVPQIFGVEGYGARPDQHLEPEIADWEWIYLAYNEPNQPDQSDIPPKIAAQNYKELTEQYPDKVVVSPATGHVDTEWFDEFWEECLILECRIDYIATHQYKGTIDERMKQLKDYSLRYGKQIWLTEFALALEEDTEKIVEFVEEFLPRLEEAGFIFRYSWFYTRYYIDHDHTDPWFWLDSNNSLMEQDRAELSLVGQAYDKPWHLESFREKFRASKKGL